MADSLPCPGQCRDAPVWLMMPASTVTAQGQRLARIQPDPLFSEPATVEDDYWRMRAEPAGRR